MENSDQNKLHIKDNMYISEPSPPPVTAPSNNTIIVFPEVVVNPGAGGDGILDDQFKSFDFNDRSIRRAFIRKVYLIVMLQLAVTTGFVCLFVLHEPTREFVRNRENAWLIYVALIFYLVTYFCMLCCEGPRRKVPYNYVFLGIFTTALSLLVAFITSFSDGQTVLLAAGITFVIVASLTLFALQTKIDFTMMSGSLLSIVVILLSVGLFAIITRNPTIHLLYAALGILVFSLFLVYDTQLMVGGGYKYSLSPEEYVFAALNIYLDVMNIFLKVLRLLR